MHSEFRLALIVYALGVAVAAENPIASAQQSKHVVAEGCLVSLIDDRNVPAEEAGKLAAVNVKEGQEVQAAAASKSGRSVGLVKLAATERKAPTPLAIIKKNIAASQRDGVKAARDAAVLDAGNRFSIEHAESLQKVAELQLELYEAANKNVRKAISELEVAKARQEVHAAKLRVKQAEHDFAKLAFAAVEKEAELAVAEESLAHRDIHSPIDGVVVEVFAQEGEWVKPGDPVFRIVNLQRLRIQATLKIADVAPGDVAGRDVSVTSESAGDGKEAFKGRIVFVHPEVRAGGRFVAWAEVENRKDARGHYRLLPGMKATMTIADAKATD